MRQLLLLAAIFYIFSGNAQELLIKKIELDWQSKQIVHVDANKTWEMPLVAKNGANFDRMIPAFMEKWQVPNNSKVTTFEVKNIVYESIPIEALYDIKIENVLEVVNSNMQVISTRNKSHVFFEIDPLVKQGHQIKKIISFEIQYQLLNDSSRNQSRTYTPNSVLASGEWFKFSVDTTGVYKLDRTFLNNLGISTNNINPKNISIYGNGGQLLPYKIGDFRLDDLQETAIYVAGEDDESFDSNDYLLFYAKGPDNWVHNNTLASVKHQKNIYTNKAYYFVHVGNQLGKRISSMPLITETPQLEITNFDDFIVHEIEQTNLYQAGQQWLGEAFDIENERSIQLQFTNLDVTFPVKITTRAAAVSLQITSLNQILNGQSLTTLSFTSVNDNKLADTAIATNEVFLNSDSIGLTLSYNNNADPAAQCFLDYIEIIGKKTLLADGNQFSFRNFDVLSTTNPVSYKVQNTPNIFQIWDVTDLINPRNIQNQSSDSNFIFTANGGELHEYIVLNEQNFFTPNQITNPRVQNQNLHALQNVDYVIITKDFLVSEAEVLAQYHRENSNLNVKVVPLYQIYNEFGSGGSDITAIRDFVKFLYDNSQPQLQYVLLYGDASFDFKGIRYDSGVVPAFESYKSYDMTKSFVTDDYYAIVSNPSEGDLDGIGFQTQDVAIARIPISTSTEASEVTAKILNYYAEVSLGDWRNQIVMMADDIDDSNGYEYILQSNMEFISDNIKQNKPLFNIKKIYADAFPQVITSGGSRYPDVNTALNNAIERGVLLADYFGHGGEDGLALERLLETHEIEAWNNSNKLPLFIVISCEFARFDNPLRPNTAGELTIRNTHGGAAYHIATARKIYTSYGNTINKKIVPALLEFDNIPRSIAENLRLVKNSQGVVGDSQRFFVFSFGDPAMKLAVPKPDVRLTHMNGVSITQSLDTISALSHVYFDGIVTNNTGETDTGFNGEVSLTVFDKPQDKETLNNDGNAAIMTFDVQESKIFRGRASVVNGQFSFDFVAPLDIRIAYGFGKLSFYADNDEIDKGGYNLDVVVGGINEEAPEDNQGPNLRLYMNDESFIDGGTTNQSPLFLAFFEDENGINTSLTSVDHDIVAVLDDDQQNSIILNDYYTTELNDFTKGSLEYRLRNLEVGQHTIQLKAYDTYNNPAEATLNFVVLDDSELVLEHVLNYPNPFVNYTEFWFNHNKPNEPLEVQIQIFTVSGKLVKTINQQVQNTGSLSRDILWDGLDDFGQKIGKGVYIYKLTVTATLSDLKAEKYEKLVILQ